MSGEDTQHLTDYERGPAPYVGGHPEIPLHPFEDSGSGTCLACERHEIATGAALASALMAANYPGDSGEDVDRLIAELAKRGYVLVTAADIHKAQSDGYEQGRHVRLADRYEASITEATAAARSVVMGSGMSEREALREWVAANAMRWDKYPSGTTVVDAEALDAFLAALPDSGERAGPIYGAAPNYYGVLDDGSLREAIGAVIQRWYRAKLLRFGTYDDGSDDLLLRDEIWSAARAARADTPRELD